MKPMFLTISFSLFSFLCIGRQKHPDRYNFALHITNPLSIASKLGLKVEGRGGDNSVVGSYTRYWGFYIGDQIAMEFRHFLPTARRGQFYFYGKVLAGTSQYNAKLAELGFDEPPQYPVLNYYGAGAGIGRRFNFGHFFISANLGAKYCNVQGLTQDNRIKYDDFFRTGPGAIVDMNCSLGFQF